MVNIEGLKAAVSFLELVRETHDIGRDHKVCCPAHEDTNPSCQIYEDHAHCYACSWHGDAVDWLETVHNLSTAEAIKDLQRRAMGYVPGSAPRRPAPPPRQTISFRFVDETVLEQHRRRAVRLDRIPAALEGRGFDLADLKRLSVAAYGDDAVLPITGPDGTVLALKRRFANPPDGVRYRYATPGHGTPAWCSPGFQGAETVLVTEGELNAMMCYLAAPHLGVTGLAGTGGMLYLEPLKGRTVYCYADSDNPGQQARDKWAAQAMQAGAAKVFALNAWPIDACDLAGSEGRAALADLLEHSMATAAPKSAQTPKPSGELATPKHRSKPSKRTRLAGWYA